MFYSYALVFATLTPETIESKRCNVRAAQPLLLFTRSAAPSGYANGLSRIPRPDPFVMAPLCRSWAGATKTPPETPQSMNTRRPAYDRERYCDIGGRGGGCGIRRDGSRGRSGACVVACPSHGHLRRGRTGRPIGPSHRRPDGSRAPHPSKESCQWTPGKYQT